MSLTIKRKQSGLEFRENEERVSVYETRKPIRGARKQLHSLKTSNLNELHFGFGIE